VATVHKTDKYSIPEAANGGTNGLTATGPVHIAIVAVQVAGPSVAKVVLGSTPEESAGSNTGETTTEITKTTRESSEAT